MDDFKLSNLSEAQNEYSIRLVNTLTPFIKQGIQSIFNEAYKLCEDNDEREKYLMTFQNFLSRVSKWNNTLVEQETERIIKDSKCSYLADLLTCVHVTQLKILTSVRVGQKQKKIDLDVPKLSIFIHRVYIETSRKIYKNVYLFDITVPALTHQRNMRDCELIIKECILNAIRESIPIEKILRSYIDKTTETEVTVEEEIVTNDAADISNCEPDKSDKPEVPVNLEEAKNLEPVKGDENLAPARNLDEAKSTALSFNNTDKVLDMGTGAEATVDAPKTIERLENISDIRNIERKKEEEEEEDETLTINSDLDPDELNDAIETLDEELMKLTEDDDLGIHVIE